MYVREKTEEGKARVEDDVDVRVVDLGTRVRGIITRLDNCGSEIFGTIICKDGTVLAISMKQRKIFILFVLMNSVNQIICTKWYFLNVYDISSIS